MPCKVSGPARPVISMTVETDNTKQPDVTSSTLRRRVLLILKLTVAGGLLTRLFVSGRLDFSVLGHAKSYTLLAVAGLVLLASMPVLVWRRMRLIRIQGLPNGGLVALIVRLSIIVFSVPGVVGTFRPARTSNVSARKKEEQGV